MNNPPRYTSLIALLLLPFFIVCNQTDYPFPVIKSIVDQYKRSITILDVGATSDSPAIAFAQIPHVAVLLGKNELLPVLKNSGLILDNITILQSHPSLKILTRLAECEHFDMVLALNPRDFEVDSFDLHLDVLSLLGEHVLAQVPQSLLATAQEKSGKALAQSYNQELGETIYLVHFSHKKQNLLRSSWYSPIQTNKYRVISSNIQKLLYLPQKNRYTFWHSGINFETFKALNGVWPTQELIEAQLEELEEATDIIVQGKTLIEN